MVMHMLENKVEIQGVSLSKFVDDDVEYKFEYHNTLPHTGVVRH